MAEKSWKLWTETATCFRAKWSLIFCAFGTLLLIVGVVITSVGIVVKNSDHHRSTTLTLCVTGPVMIGCGFLPLILSCIFWTYVTPRRYSDRLQTTETNLPSPANIDVHKEDYVIDLRKEQQIPTVVINDHLKLFPNKQQFLPESFNRTQKQTKQDMQPSKETTSTSPSSESSDKNVSQLPFPYHQRTQKRKDYLDHSTNAKHPSILKNNFDNGNAESILRHNNLGSNHPRGRNTLLPQQLFDGQQSSTSSDRSSKPIVRHDLLRVNCEDRNSRRVSFDDVDTIYFTERVSNTRRHKRKISRTGGNYLTIY